MEYCNANQAVKLMEFGKACDNAEASALLYPVMTIVNDKIVAAAKMSKGNVRHDVKTCFYREEMPSERVMTILVEKLCDQLIKLGYRVAKETATTLLIVWYTDK